MLRLSTYRSYLSSLCLVSMVCALTLVGGMARADQAAALVAAATCGDDQLTCGSKEKCCEHRIATFCENETCSSVRVEGRCVARDKSCSEFWCGNRQCQTRWLRSRDVCCVYFQAGDNPEYSCAASELSCPGNTTQLSIRPTVASRTLQGS